MNFGAFSNGSWAVRVSLNLSLVLFTANIAHGFSISAVTLSPSNVVPAATEVRMTVDITTPSQGTWLYAPTQISSNASGLRVDVYPTSGPLTAIGSLSETVTLGVFPPGTHSYEVVIHPNFQVNWGTRTNRGSFTVTGENPRPVVSMALVDGQAAETLIDQNAIFWAEFRVLRTGSTTEALTVFLNTQQGSARRGEDYWLDGVSSNSTVRIPPGTNAVNVRLYPIDDNFYEGDETVFFHLIAPPAASDSYEIDFTHSSVSMVIHDNDPVTTRLEITAPRDGQHFEAGDVIELRAQVIGPGSSNAWTVEFFDGPERLGATPPGGSIWWQNAIGGEHVIHARASSSNGATLEARLVNISVGPGPAWPVVSILSGWNTAEPCPVCLVTPGVFTLSRTGPTSNSLTVYLEYDGTAAPGVDYQTLPGQLTIPAGTNSAQFLVLPIDDLLVEGPEIVRASIALPEIAARGYIASVHANEAMVVIHDGEPGAPEIRLDIVKPKEGAQFATGTTIEVSALGVWTQGEVDQPVEFFAGNVFIGRSNPPQLGRPTIPGLPSVHTIFWTNPPPGQHTLTARFESLPGLAVTSPPVHITVDGEPTSVIVSIEATQPIAEESSEPFRRMNLVGVFRISRTGPTDHSLPVFVRYSGTATMGVDYPALPILVEIPAGASSIEIRLEAIADSQREGIESVVASLSHCPPDTQPPLGMPCFAGFDINPSHERATVFIRDDGITEASLAITSPKDGAKFEVGETILIEAVAIDLHGYISRVEFWDGETRIGESEITFIRAPDPGTPIHHQFAWSGAAAGNHVLTARAANANGLALRSEPVRIAVGTESNQPPHVSILKPANGSEFPPDAAIEIVAEARDLDGYVRKMEFFADGRKIGESSVEFIHPPTPGQTQTFAFVWHFSLPGTHSLVARAADDAGAVGASAPVEIRVAAAHPWPIVTVTAPDSFAVEPRSNAALNTATFRIRRYGPTNNALPVAYSLHGTATNGSDYETLSGTAMIPAGSRSVAVTVRPLADNLSEGIETVRLRLEELPTAGPVPLYEVGRPGTAIAVISDYPWWPLPREARCVTMPDGLRHICFAADAGFNYRLEASHDLRNWETLFDATSSDGAWHFIDAEDFPNRFYRLTPEPVELVGE